MLRILIILFCCLGIVTAIRCLYCDSHKTCKDPFHEECPGKTRCYTVKQKGNGLVTDRGCAHSCEKVHYKPFETCEDCEHDHCNGPKNSVWYNVDIEHYQNDNGEIKIIKEKEGSIKEIGYGFITTPSPVDLDNIRIPKQESFWSLFWSSLWSFRSSAASSASGFSIIAVPVVLRALL